MEIVLSIILSIIFQKNSFNSYRDQKKFNSIKRGIKKKIVLLLKLKITILDQFFRYF